MRPWGLFPSGVSVVVRRLRIAGDPDVDNAGTIEIGAGCHIGSRPIRSHLVVKTGAKVCLGENVFISYGAAISSHSAISIGDNTRIGPFCMILDNDYHKVGDRDSLGETAAIEIGRNVTLGARVIVLRGARIGAGATVLSGSTVAGLVPAGMVAGGVPARVGGNNAERVVSRSVATIMQRVFGLAAPPGVRQERAQIAAWTDIGAVRLLLALEEAFDTTFCPGQMCKASNVGEVTRLVLAARGGRARSTAVAAL